MCKKLLFVCVYGVLLGCYSTVACAFAVDSAKIADLNFGEAVPLVSSSATVALRITDGEPLWLRSMKKNGSDNPELGLISFVSSEVDADNELHVKPTLAATRLDLQSGGGCSLRAEDLVLSSNDILLNIANETKYLKVGGVLQVSGYCDTHYTYSSSVTVSYTVERKDGSLVEMGNVNVPVKFKLYYQAGVESNQDMDFGTILTNGTGGTVVLSTDGTITTSNDTNLHYLRGGSAGEISIYGVRGLNVRVESPTSSSVVQICKSAGVCMNISSFTFSPSTNFTLQNPDAAGLYSEKLRLGATLTVADDQPTGTYTGTVNVIISY